eukprot:5703821-Pyramimonas_sp.AAC.1
MASLLYGAKAHGASPNERLQTRRHYARALRRAWPGRCLTTLIAVEGTDPEHGLICGRHPTKYDNVSDERGRRSSPDYSSNHMGYDGNAGAALLPHSSPR